MLSPDPAAGMNTTNVANVGAENDPTDSTTSMSRIHEATDEADQTTAAIPPFFRLPRELRDEIYDLVALSEQTLYCDITLRPDQPSQKTTHVDRGTCRTWSKSQFEIEYSDAVSRRVKALAAGVDRNGLQMRAPGIPEYAQKIREREVKAEDIWLEVSEGVRADGRISQNVHALVLAIPLCLSYDPRPWTEKMNLPVRFEPGMIFKFEFPDKLALGPRLRFDCYWEGMVEPHAEGLYLPSEDGSVLQQVLGIGKEVSWKGCLREYMLWQRYVVKYARRGASPRPN